MSGDLMELVNDCSVMEAVDSEKMDMAIEKANELRHLGFKAVADRVMQEATKKSRLAKIAEHKYIRITNEKIGLFLNRKASAEALESARRASVELQATAAARTEDQKKRGIRDLLIGGVGKAKKSVIADDFYWKNYSAGLSLSVPDFGSLAGIVTRSQDRNAVSVRTGYMTAEGVNIVQLGDVEGYGWCFSEVPVYNYEGIPPASVLKTMAEHLGRGLFDLFTVATVEKVQDPLLLGRVAGCDDRFFIAQWGDDVSLDDLI